MNKEVQLFGVTICTIKESKEQIDYNIFTPSFLKNRQSKRNVVSADVRPDTLFIGLQEGGGLGDSLFQLIYLKELRKLIQCKCILDFYCRGYNAFENIPFLDNVSSYIPNNPNKERYDIWITSRRLWDISITNEEKVARLSPEFFEFYKKNKDFISNAFLNTKNINDNMITQYALLFGKNRFE